MRRGQRNSRGRRIPNLQGQGPLVNANSTAGETSQEGRGNAASLIAVAGPSPGVATISASGVTFETAFPLPEQVHQTPALPNFYNFTIDPNETILFATELDSFCTSFAPLFIVQRGIRDMLDLVVEKIFRNNNGRYNVFLLDATICSTSSLGSVWQGPSAGPSSTGLRFRHFIRLNQSSYVIYIFDQPATIPVIEFSLEYMHKKFRDQQLMVEIAVKASGRCEVGINAVLLRSTRSGAYYSYPKNYLFFQNGQQPSDASGFSNLTGRN